MDDRPEMVGVMPDIMPLREGRPPPYGATQALRSFVRASDTPGPDGTMCLLCDAQHGPERPLGAVATWSLRAGELVAGCCSACWRGLGENEEKLAQKMGLRFLLDHACSSSGAMH